MSQVSVLNNKTCETAIVTAESNATGRLTAVLVVAAVALHVAMAATVWSSSRMDAVLMVLMALVCSVCLSHLWRGPHLRDWVVTGALSAVMLGWHLPMLTATAGSSAGHTLNVQMQTGMVMAGAHGLHWTLALILVLVAVVEAGASVAAIIDGLMSRRSALPTDTRIDSLHR